MRNDPILMHYGVKGMKWRNRKGIGLKEGVQNASKPSSIVTGAGRGATVGKNTVIYTNLYKKRQDQLNKKPEMSKEYEEKKKSKSKLKKESKEKSLKKGANMGAEFAKQLAATPKHPKSKLKKKK